MFAKRGLAFATRLRLALASVSVLTLTGSFLVVPPALADPVKPTHLAGQVEKLDRDGGEVAGRGWPVRKPSDAVVPAPVWPAAGTAIRSSLKKRTGSAAAASPAAPAADVRAEVVDRRSVPQRWRAGVVARVSATDTGTASVAVDYAKFRYAYGGGWASRLRLWRLPECALTTPEKAGCTATALPSSNDTSSGTVTADVAVAAAAPSATAAAAPGKASTLVALAADESGSAGDFGATPLAASSTWSAGGSTGGFSWSYPVRVPPAINGPAPVVSLSYSSSSVDGRSAATNNQPSWVGEGFEYSPGFIERRYVACSEDKSGSPNNPAQTADLCWRSDNATMSLGGSSTELIYESGKGWHARSEDGSEIVKLTGATNGDENGEHWRVTSNDGTQYFFGLNNLTGQGTATNSAWTVPVYGNHAGEPGHGTTFASSRETQAWRWNLDYAIDVNGNTLSLFYDKETNKYGAEATESKTVSYVRGGTLSRVDYGTWDRGSTDRSVAPLAQVFFDTADRCNADCATHSGTTWPDTPWDQECKSTATTCSNYSPSFWSTKRLSKIRTRVWDATKATPDWQDVDSYTLSHSFPSPGDGEPGGLWLDSIVRTGHVGGTVTMPPVTLDPVAKTNRVLTKHNTTNNWQRLSGIHTETGALIQVTYSNPECTATNLPASPETNTKLCYPVIGPDPLSTSGGDVTEWWHKYVVRQVSQTDVQLEDGHQAPTINTYYTYEGTPAWHYSDDDGLSKAKYRTWNQFRGYAGVSVRVGDSNPTLTRTKFLRGMHGDREAPAGGKRSVVVPASLGAETVNDEDEFAGMAREETVYNGTDDKPVSKTVNVPWRSTPTASRTVNGDTVTARFTGLKTTYQGTALGTDGSDGWRVSGQTSTLDDAYGVANSVQDHGDVSKSGDEKCTSTSYNRNIAKNILTLVKQVTVKALPCDTAPAGKDVIISDTRTFYDGATSVDTVPSKGRATQVDTLKSWTPSGGTEWLPLTSATFDAFGRQATGTDLVRANTTTTVYTPENGLLNKRTQTTQQGWVTTEEIHPYWGVPGKVTDLNGRTAEGTYDALGRTTKVWETGWPRSEHPDRPSTAFTYYYSPQRTSYPYVKTEALNSGGGTTVTYQIYDGMLRPRQTQKVAVGGGRIVSDTLYDSYGRTELTFSAHAEPGDPSGTLWWEPEWSVPAQELTLYDRAGRATDKIFKSGDGVTNLVEKWRTRTTYQGDRTTVVPPQGGTPTTMLTDILGRTVEARQYTTASGINGAYDATKYFYDAKEKLAVVRDSAGDEWKYTYDLRGRETEASDPDKGTTKSEYNDAGDLTKTIDARGEVLVYSYDGLGRQTGVYDDAVTTANRRTELKYDRLFTGVTVKGQLTESIRYDNGNAYKWQARGFTTRYQVSGDQYVIPAAETGLAGTYIYSHGYSPYTGEAATIGYPAAGGLVDESVTTKFDTTYGLPTSMTSAWSSVGSYVTKQLYSSYGEPTVTQLKIAGGLYAEQSTTYELDTRRVHQVRVKPETATGTVVDRAYEYDPAGNILSVSDNPQVGAADTQCFGYDALQRLNSAWTPKSGISCATAPTTSNLGGPAPYWYDWTIDKIGNRTKEVSHAAAGDTVRNYAVPTAGPNVIRPHAVTSMTTTQPGQSTGTTVSYGYDNAGNMTTRPGATNGQVLNWDAEGRLSTVVEGGKTTTNLYDAGGSRLIRRDAGGTTLYLPGQEIRRTVSGSTATLSCTRFYGFAGSTVASRSTGQPALTWLFSDHQGTQQVSVNAAGQQVSIRRQNPYGEARGANPTWPTNKGFVGGDIDPTGLTHLGARDYDPALGRFISVDPIQDLADPQQWNAYAYANNSPVTLSDPTGTDPCPGGGGGCGYPDTPTHVSNPGACGSANSCEQHQRVDGNGGGTTGKGGGRGGSGNNGSKAGCNSATTCDHDNYQKTERIRAAMIQIMSDSNPDSRTEIGGFCRMDPAMCAAYLQDLKRGGVPWRIAASIHCGESVACRQDYGIGGMAGGPSLGSTLNPVVGDAIFESIVGGGSLTVVRLVRLALSGKNREAEQALRACVVSYGTHNSFDPATLVLMADGTTKPIRDVQVGDLVLAADPETGARTAKKVTDLYNNLDVDLVDVEIARASGDPEILHTTAEHPFWDETLARWVLAGDLQPGHRLSTTEAGTVTVLDRRPVPGSNFMLNLSVSDLHTYYVLAGTTPVLVHNDNGIYSWPNTDGPIPQRGQTALYAQFDQRTGEFLKWGVWTNTTGNYSRYKQKYLKERGIQTTVLRNFDSKEEAHAVESDLVARAPGRYNLEQYAGSKSVGEDPLDIIRNHGYRGGPGC
ncbi:polymorphic toxin-type HINT domain-containing protein [Actinoplanes sp. NPDC049668]|uniref:polymorphic toxin-type HINT domain-containing protein n=1 Tax=unclassified Actinoplanes TaxID=2626549 RepID=UPI00339ECA0E